MKISPYLVISLLDLRTISCFLQFEHRVEIFCAKQRLTSGQKRGHFLNL
jgi:hypothetical protein